jgi:phosphatidylinositol dimannoside acyltransferase
VTSDEGRLEAPHRRATAGQRRIVERTAVVAYRATAWVLSVVPQGPARFVIGGLAQASYLLWPAKRRWSNANFGHVLGLPPGDARVRRLALRAYGEYGRYLVELMRLPSLPPEAVDHLVSLDLDAVDRLQVRDGTPETRGGLILTVTHMGSNEAIGASIARHGLPISVVADDSSFPELFDHLRRQRERWGVTLIPWRNLREIFGVLRRGEMLGLLVDWGYRSDGVPVRLFDAWTTLPAGPATLAAKTGSRILAIAIVRADDGTFHVSWQDPIVVRPNDPAELQRATQAMADRLAAAIGAAPHQWYSFKPMWPASAAEAADLERRALEMQAGRPDPGPSRGLPRDEADQVGTMP